jgi:thioredoxin 1
MLGVMGELEQRYPGAMVVEFVNTAERPAEAQRLGVQIIPTQIFYSPDNRELFRHVGVFRAEEIVAKWAELGFPMTATAER